MASAVTPEPHARAQRFYCGALRTKPWVRMDKGSLPLCRRQACSEAERPKETFFKLFIRGEMGLLFLGAASWSCHLSKSSTQKRSSPRNTRRSALFLVLHPLAASPPIAHDLSGKMIALHLRTENRRLRTSSASPQPKSDLPRQICGDQHCF